MPPPHFPFGRKKKSKEDSLGGNLGEKTPISQPEGVDASDTYSIGMTEHFRWVAESGVSSVQGADWLTKNAIPYLERAYEVYRDNVLQVGNLVRLPVRVTIRASSQCQGGIAGSTGSGSLTYCAGEWTSNQYCYGIITHELCNLFTGECITAEWPTAWWANHRSPFPTMIANEVMRILVPRYFRMWGDYGDPLVVMFERLYRTYPGVFARMFQKMRELHVSLSGFEEPYLSQIVYYFMFCGAQKALGKYFVSPPMPPIDLQSFQKLESNYHLGVLSLPVE